MTAVSSKRVERGAVLPRRMRAWTAHDTNVIAPATGDGICCEIIINCTVAGNVVLEMAGDPDGTTTTLPVATGQIRLAGEFRRVLSTGTTATATIYARFF